MSFLYSSSPGASNYYPNYDGPLLNEIMVLNTGSVKDSEGRIASWVELANPNPIAWNVSGMRLGLDPDGREAWTIPEGVAVPASGYRVVWWDGFRPPSSQPEDPLCTGRLLPSQGGTIFLFNAQGQQMDSVSYGFQIIDQPIGRSGGTWRLLSQPTPGAANSAAAVLGDFHNLRVNEWCAHADVEGDWFELYNSDAEPVALNGLFLSDDPSIAGLTKYQVSSLSFIAGRSWVKWIADGRPEAGPNHTNFRLHQGGETLRIYSRGVQVDSIDFGLQSAAGSQGRWPDGATEIRAFPTTPTPGQANQVDTDGDGMPDAWELAHGFNPYQSSDALEDADGDGLSNLAEYLCGTDPRDASSCLRLGMGPPNNGKVRLFLEVAPWKRVTLQYRDLPSDPWTDLSLTPEFLPPQRVQIEDVISPVVGLRVYRLLLQPGY